MAAQVGSMFVSLALDQQGYVRGLQQVERTTGAALGRMRKSAGVTERSVAGLQGAVGAGFRPVGIIAASSAMDGMAGRAVALRGHLAALSAVAGGLFTGNRLIRAAEDFTSITNQLRVVSDDFGELRAQFKAVAQVADDARSPLRETATLFARLRRSAPGREIGEILQATGTISKALQIGGAAPQEAASAALQFSQAIASNRLGGEELRAILETPLGLALAKGLGVTIGKFRELAREGKLTADVLFDALARVRGEIDQQFSESVRTLGQSLTLANNKFTQWAGELDRTYAFTRRLGDGVLSLADNLDTLAPIVGTVGTGIAAIFGGRLLAGAANATVGRAFQTITTNATAARSAVALTQQQIVSLESAIAVAQFRMGQLAGQRTAALAGGAQPGSKGVATLDKRLAGQGNQVRGMHGQLALLNADLARSTKESGNLAIAWRTLRGAGAGLLGLLGGPWGVAFAGAIGVTTLLAVRSAEAAAQLERANAAIAKRLTEIGQTGDPAALESIERSAAQERLAAVNQEIEDMRSISGPLLSQLDNLSSFIRRVGEAEGEDGLVRFADHLATVRGELGGTGAGITDVLAGLKKMASEAQLPPSVADELGRIFERLDQVTRALPQAAAEAERLQNSLDVSRLGPVWERQGRGIRADPNVAARGRTVQTFML